MKFLRSYILFGAGHDNILRSHALMTNELCLICYRSFINHVDSACRLDGVSKGQKFIPTIKNYEYAFLSGHQYNMQKKKKELIRVR